MTPRLFAGVCAFMAAGSLHSLADQPPIVANWNGVRRIYVGQFAERQMFQYYPNPSLRDQGKKIIEMLNRLKIDLLCTGFRSIDFLPAAGRQHTGFTAPIPVDGPNQILIYCNGRCDGLTYSIWRSKPGYIWHRGITDEFPFIDLGTSASDLIFMEFSSTYTTVDPMGVGTHVKVYQWGSPVWAYSAPPPCPEPE